MRTSRGFAVVLTFVACASAPRRAEVLLVDNAASVSASDLARCRNLGEVAGSGVGGWGTMRDQQQYWARREVVAIAEAKGATHVWVTWERDDPTLLTVHGVAYDCR